MTDCIQKGQRRKGLVGYHHCATRGHPARQQPQHLLGALKQRMNPFALRSKLYLKAIRHAFEELQKLKTA